VTVRDSSVRGDQRDINALATVNENSASIMLWNYHDLNIPGEPANIELNINGIPSQKIMLKHYRIDNEHSNAYEVWKKMGEPQNPTSTQYTALEDAGQLQMISNPEEVIIKNGSLSIPVDLPGQAVSLLLIEFE